VRLRLLGLHLRMTGEGMRRIGAELLHPLAPHILMNVQVPRHLRHPAPAIFHKPDCLDLELPD